MVKLEIKGFTQAPSNNGGVKGSRITLESVLYGGEPKVELDRAYLEMILNFRQDPKWRQTGILSDEQKIALAEIMDRDPTIPVRMSKELRLICNATRMGHISDGRPKTTREAFVLNGDFNRGEVRSNEGM